MEIKKAKNVLFAVPLFDINERDGMNTAKIERSFPQALRRMYDFGGFFIKISRMYVYTCNTRKVKKAEQEKIIVFGTRTSTDCCRQIAEESQHYELDKIEQAGITEVVFNSRVKKFLAFTPENMTVIEDSCIPLLINGKGYGSGLVPIASDYTAELIGVDYKNNGGFNVIDVIKDLTYQSQAAGFKIIRRDYYTNGKHDQSTVLGVYYKGLVVPREHLRSHRPELSVSTLQKRSRAPYFVLLNDGIEVALPEFVLMNATSPRSWLSQQ